MCSCPEQWAVITPFLDAQDSSPWTGTGKMIPKFFPSVSPLAFDKISRPFPPLLGTVNTQTQAMNVTKRRQKKPRQWYLQQELPVLKSPTTQTTTWVRKPGNEASNTEAVRHIFQLQCHSFEKKKPNVSGTSKIQTLMIFIESRVN